MDVRCRVWRKAYNVGFNSGISKDICAPFLVVNIQNMLRTATVN